MRDHTYSTESNIDAREILTEAYTKTPKKTPPKPRTHEEKYQGFSRRLITRLSLLPTSRVVNADASKKSAAQRRDELDETVGKQFDRTEFAARLMHRFADFTRRTRSNVQRRELDGKIIFSGDWRVAHLLTIAAEILGVKLDDEIKQALNEAGGVIEVSPALKVARPTPRAAFEDVNHPTFATRFSPSPRPRPRAVRKIETQDQPHFPEGAVFEEIPPTPDEVAAQGSAPCWVCGRLKEDGDHKRCA